eukprot:359397-Chlamydomonas_euryale.AAC.11
MVDHDFYHHQLPHPQLHRRRCHTRRRPSWMTTVLRRTVAAVGSTLAAPLERLRQRWSRRWSGAAQPAMRPARPSTAS